MLFVDNNIRYLALKKKKAKAEEMLT